MKLLQHINGKSKTDSNSSPIRRGAGFAWTYLVIGLCLLVQTTHAVAGSFTVLPSQGFQRQSGAPVTESISFPVLDPTAAYTLHIYNGGLEDHELTGELVSSSTITLNGSNIFGPSDFNQNVDSLNTAVTLQSSNELSVTLKGKSGGVITLLILGEDEVAPVITAAITPVANAAGWHQADTTINFTCFDATSGIATCPAPLVVTLDGANQVHGGTAIDNAGNQATVSVTINLDKTLPTIETLTDVPANAAGWHRSAVEVSFDCQDTLSGIASCTPPVNVATQGSGQLVNGSAIDIAGNIANTSLTLKIDLTPPSLQTQFSAQPNAAGWFNQPVTLSFTCADALSGVQSCPADELVALNGQGQVVSVSATDNAGNETQQSHVVNVDTISPVVNISSPVPGALIADLRPVISLIVYDSLLDPDSLALTVDGSAFDFSCSVIGYSATCTPNNDLPEGDILLAASAKDLAGNTGSTQVSFQIEFDLDGDGIPDSLDDDIDGDGISNEYEEQLLFDPRDPDNTPSDIDGDGIPDVLDNDRDGDGVDNDTDTYPDDPSRSQLDAVTGLQTAQQGQQILLGWNTHSETFVSGYLLERRLFGSSAWQRLTATKLAGTSYIDANLQNGNAYQYRVIAVDQNDIEGLGSGAASQFFIFNDRRVNQAAILWSDYKAALGWTHTLVSNETIRIYRGTASAGDIAYQASGNAYTDANSQWQQDQSYHLVSVLSFNNPLTSSVEQREGPVFDLMLAALPALEVSLENARQTTVNAWQVEAPTGLALTIVGSVENALNAVSVSLASSLETLSTTASNGQFQFVLRDVQHEALAITVTEQGAPADRNITLALNVIADNTPLMLQLDNPGQSSTGQGSIEVSGRVINADGGISRLSAASDRFPGLNFGLTLIENDQFFGEVPLDFGLNQLQVDVAAGNGESAAAAFAVTRDASVVPAIQFTSHSPNQVVSQAEIDVSGRLYSSLELDQIQLDVNGRSAGISQVQPGVYAFTQPGIELAFGFNRIIAQTRTPSGNSQAGLIVYFQDTQSEPDEPLVLQLTTPNDLEIINANILLVRGQLRNASSNPQVLVNGESTALFGSEQSGWLFNHGIDVSTLPEGDVVVIIDGSADDNTPLQLIRTVRLDRSEPLLSIDNNLLDPPAVNEIIESPFVISGTVSDTNLAGLSLNGQEVKLTPGNGANSYVFDTSLLLPRGQQSVLNLIALDRAGNETRLSYDVLSNPGPAVEVIQPLANSQYLVFNNSQLIETIARVSNAPVDSTLTVEVGGQSNAQAVTQAIIASESSVTADTSIDEIRFILRGVNGDTLASQTIPITIIDAANIPLKLEKTVPQQGTRFREPHHPLQFYFNRPVALADLVVDVRETVHGNSYQANQPSGAGLGELYQGEVVEVHKDQAPVAGGLSLLPGERIVEFYPATDLSYGARVFVSLSHQGNQLTRFFYEVRSNPTFIKTSLFDQAGQAIPNIKVTVPALKLEGSTDSNGTLMLGGSAPASQEMATGLYQLMLNPDHSNPGYGTRDLKVQITSGKVNQFTGLRLPELSAQVAYRYLQSGSASNVLVSGDLLIDTQNARLEFPNGQTDGQVHVQLANYSDGLYTVADIQLAPLWMFNLQPGPIRVTGEIGLNIKMPTLFGNHDYAPPNGTRVMLMGLDHDSGLVEPIGVGRIDALRVISEGLVRASRLDLLGYQFIAAELQTLARRYAEGEIGLDALKQGVLGQ